MPEYKLEYNLAEYCQAYVIIDADNEEDAKKQSEQIQQFEHKIDIFADGKQIPTGSEVELYDITEFKR